MTITFKCPGCGNLCGFNDQHAGKTARCTRCNQQCIIPAHDGDKAQKAKVDLGKPLEGYYRAVLVDFWKTLIAPENATGLLAAVIAIAIKFFVGHTDFSFSVVGPSGQGFRAQLIIGQIITVLMWGYLFWYYKETVSSTAFDPDDLPDLTIGRGFEFLANVIKSTYLFIIAVLLACFPFFIAATMLEKMGVQHQWLLHCILLGGPFMLPGMIMILATTESPWLVFRYDLIYASALRCPGPYALAGGLTVTAAFLQLEVKNYGHIQDAGPEMAALHLGLNIIVLCVTILAMRSVGLFCHHYRCHLDWMWR